MVGFFSRKRSVVVVQVDEVGVRRLRDGAVFEDVRWDELASVEIKTTAEGPVTDDVFWLLASRLGTGVAVPSEQAPDGFLERLQSLAGFDNEAVIRAMTSTSDATFHCWSQTHK